jgi:hypothetical protein
MQQNIENKTYKNREKKKGKVKAEDIKQRKHKKKRKIVVSCW